MCTDLIIFLYIYPYLRSIGFRYGVPSKHGELLFVLIIMHRYIRRGRPWWWPCDLPIMRPVDSWTWLMSAVRALVRQTSRLHSVYVVHLRYKVIEPIFYLYGYDRIYRNKHWYLIFKRLQMTPPMIHLNTGKALCRTRQLAGNKKTFPVWSIGCPYETVRRHMLRIRW